MSVEKDTGYHLYWKLNIRKNTIKPGFFYKELNFKFLF